MLSRGGCPLGNHASETTEGSQVAPEALVFTSESGAGNRIRTGDPQLGKLMLYQLSYSRETCRRFLP